MLDNPDVLPYKFLLIQVHCTFVCRNNLHGVSLENEDVTAGGAKDDYQFLRHLRLVGAIVWKVRDGAGLRAQNFDLLSKPIPSKLGSDPLDDLLFRIELYNICVILPRGYILNHIYTRQFSRASLRVNVCDICQR